MQARTKYKLPTHGELTHIKIDLKKLQDATDKLANEYVDVKTANKMLCDNHMALSKSVYDNFKQINLTELNGEELPYTDSIKERREPFLLQLQHNASVLQTQAVPIQQAQIHPRG